MAILSYNLNIVGEADVARALASIERRFVQHNQRINRILSAGGGTIRQRNQSPQKAAQESTRVAVAAQKKVDKAHAESVRKATREVRSQQMLAQRGDIVSHRLRLQHKEREKRTEIANIRTSLKERMREEKRARGDFRRSIGTGVTNAGSTLSSVGKGGAAMLGVGGSILAGAAVSEQLKLDEQIRRFSVAGRGAGEAGMNPADVRRQVMQIAMARGVSPESVMGGAQQFQTVTGRGDVGMKMADTFATFGQATGGDPKEIAGAAAALFQNFKIEDINELTEALAKLTFQGKKGSFEFSAMADQLPRVTAGLAGRGIGGGADGVAKMGAMLQVVQRGTGSEAVTSTAVDAVFRQMVAKAGDIQSGGAFSTGKKVNIFEGGDPTAAMRGDIDMLIADVLKASGGNAIELQKIFGDEGMRGMNMFAAEFKGAGGGEAGHAAVLKMFDEFAEVGGNYTEIQRDAADVQQSTSIQLEMALMELKEAFGDELLPVIRDLTPEIKALAPAARTAVGMLVAMGSALADNPILGIGAIMAACITAEIAKASLASALQTGVISPLGMVGVAAGMTAGALAAFVGWLEMKRNEGKGAAKDAALRGDAVRQKAQAEIDKNGTLSPETRKELGALQATETQTTAWGDHYLKESKLTGLNRQVGAMLGIDEYEENQRIQMATQGAATSKEYQAGAAETKRLMGVDKMSQQYGPEMFKAQEVGAEIGKAAVAEIQRSGAGNLQPPPRTVKPNG